MCPIVRRSSLRIVTVGRFSRRILSTPILPGMPAGPSRPPENRRGRQKVIGRTWRLGYDLRRRPSPPDPGEPDRSRSDVRNEPPHPSGPSTAARPGTAGRSAAVALFVGLCTWAAATAQQPTWRPAGPSPNQEGQVERLRRGEVVGTVHAVVPHPTEPDIVYIGTVNGGVCKTTDLDKAINDDPPRPPHWTCLIDGHGPLSIGALEFDPTDAGRRTLVAGLGWFSSLGDGGARSGLLRTDDGSDTWAAIDGGGTLDADGSPPLRPTAASTRRGRRRST